MKYYPIFLRVAGRQCLVIGGGPVAEQKVHALLKADARVTVVSPHVTPALVALATAGTITCLPRHYAKGDLRDAFLVCAATDDRGAQEDVAAEAHETGVLLNVVDRPELCDFIVPSVVERGDLVIATSTSGASPALAKRIRQNLEDAFGPEYAFALQLLRRLRRRLADEPPADRQRIFAALVDSPLLDYLRDHQIREVDRLLATTVGNGVSLATLGMELNEP